jgi:hypothetical protein
MKSMYLVYVYFEFDGNAAAVEIPLLLVISVMMN